jgi:myo-inositol-1(or 4)-monophosphatase
MISEQDQRHYLAIARRAVAEAAELVRTHTPGKLTEKGDRDPASEVDLAVERFVRDFLHNKTPEIEFLGEEEGGHLAGHGLLWMLDPIDGTVNFLHGFPLCAVSLSLFDADTVVAAVIDLPFIGTQYTAILGQGAYADDRRLRVSQTSTLANALISIDQYAFGDDAERKNRLRLRLTERLAHDAQRVRMLGASAIDLAWTAEGRLDACIMLGNKPWDTSAGVLIAREAGARVLDQDGSEHSPQSHFTIAVTPTLEADLMAAVQATLAEQRTAPDTNTISGSSS